MSEPVRHHYIPIFYSKRWCGADGRLCEYSRPHKIVKAKRKHPAATGYVDGLYTVPGLPPDRAQYIEKTFMGATDDWAARAQQVFLNPGGPAVRDLNAREKIGWARFLYSMVVRTPENLARMQQNVLADTPAFLDEYRDKYDSLRSPTDPVTFAEFKEKYLANPRNLSAANILPNLLNSERIIITFASFRFSTLDIKARAKHTFLTSDRPVMMTNGLTKPDAHIAIPLTPERLFIATKHDDTYNSVLRMGANDLVTAVNSKVAEQARKFVYGVNDSQLRFVANRLGKMVQSTPLG